ncbi:MAG TPA: hypothetical protein VNX01_15860 [Bacteroidia bacterium]|nr:hypothetical protein [Bacteroidia bacterium]
MQNETTTNEEKQERKLDPLFLIGLAFSMIGFVYTIIKFLKL